MRDTRPAVRETVGGEALSLLVVDDEPSVLTAIQRTLRRLRHPIVVAENLAVAEAALDTGTIAVVISDYRVGTEDGVGFLTRVRSRFPSVQRILMTGYADESALAAAINESAVFRFVPKPWDPHQLQLVVEDSFAQYALVAENERLTALARTHNEDLRALNRRLEDEVERRTAQLERAKLEWERTFDAIFEPVAIVDRDWRVVRANLALAEHAGVPIRDVPGRHCHALIAARDTPCPGCPLPSALNEGSGPGVDVAARERVLRVWAYRLDPAEAGRGEAAVCTYRDVTEERALQAKLQRTEKLAALGLFVGGVAHEINNPLTAILGQAQIALRDPTVPDGLRSSLQRVEANSLRCRRIISSLQAFAQGAAALDRSPIDLGILVAEAVVRFRADHAVPPGLSIEVDTDPELPRIRGDAALLHQLLRNLLDNAVHATRDDGSIRIELSRDPGGQARIRFSDDGSGVDPDSLRRIFDPFFTTKGNAGTGLGLSIVHRIVEKHGGHIDVRSEPGAGTTFELAFPAAPAEA